MRGRILIVTAVLAVFGCANPSPEQLEQRDACIARGQHGRSAAEQWCASHNNGIGFPRQQGGATSPTGP